MFTDTQLERWLAIPVAPRYEINTSGQIRRVSTGKILKQQINDGYRVISIRVDGVCKLLRVNRMVLLTFEGPPSEEDMQAAHLDGDRLNNHRSNLDWATNKVNASHRAIHGTGARGQKHGCARLTDEQARSILQRVRIANRKTGDRGNVRQLAEEFNVALETIGMLGRRKTWKHLDS